MSIHPLHTFHIPVMGLGFTVDTPVKVAKYGISSVVSVIEDELLERMREVICRQHQLPFAPISRKEEDAKALRITAYLNTMNEVVKKQMAELTSMPFDKDNALHTYFELLPEHAELKKKYRLLSSMPKEQAIALEQELKQAIQPGSIDVNIMTKVDKLNYDEHGEVLPTHYSDALTCLRGYALSDLNSAMVFSAGLNPRLYSYCEQFPDFFPDEYGTIRKRIILKVSDYRSALVQGKFFAKKGIWISEFRIESGINCGGHAFVSNGMLFGPILEEFKTKRSELYQELFQECQKVLAANGKPPLPYGLVQRITAQGGIGTAEENEFLLSYYNLDATGWGSPFLMVPEVTNVDKDTLQKLVNASAEDYYLSEASPLGVPFNNLRDSSSELQRKHRIEKNRPGSPCYKKYLAFNTEYTDTPICTASRQYQKLRIDEVLTQDVDSEAKSKAMEEIIVKDCLCEGLGVSALLNHGLSPAHQLTAVTICPGPNLAYFSGVYTLKQMVDHIYGRENIMLRAERSNLFINEYNLYLEYIRTHYFAADIELDKKKVQFLESFRKNLNDGLHYYESLFESYSMKSELFGKSQLAKLHQGKKALEELFEPVLFAGS